MDCAGPTRFHLKRNAVRWELRRIIFLFSVLIVDNLIVHGSNDVISFVTSTVSNGCTLNNFENGSREIARAILIITIVSS